MISTQADAAVRKVHLAYIDCLRGYAVMLVIASHLTEMFPELPYPVHRLTISGWFGVQLFFLASAITLLQSWNAEWQRFGRVSFRTFFLRRFFRIAPAYYLAAILYAVLKPPPAGFGWNVLASLSFTNALFPTWSLGTQSIVPGGWSIGAEFAFYALFPLFAAYATTLGRAALVFLGALGFGVLANRAILPWLDATPPDDIVNGLFFWFPNQASVFALGGIAYFLVQGVGIPPRLRRWIARWNTAIALAAALAFCALAYVPLGHNLGDGLGIPAFPAVSVAFSAVIVALSAGPSILVNPAVAMMGQVSFSAYLLHFAVLQAMGAFPAVAHTQSTGYAAIAAFAIAWPVVVLATFALASLSYRWIEAPMVRFGKTLTRVRADAPLTSARS